MSDLILNFWNDRAALKETAGSNDVIAKSIEIEALSDFFRDGLDVMEFGCGSGVTALELAHRFSIKLDAYDYSESMVIAARELAASKNATSAVKFAVGDITAPPFIEKKYDIVFTERMVINLSGWEVQRTAIETLCKYLKPGGKLLLLENSVEGLEQINKLRSIVGLEIIAAPWHNIYLDDGKLKSLHVDGCVLTQIIPYSSTYYFLSRVVNAWLAKLDGHEPLYDAPINQLALSLPAIGDCAQGKIWVFEKVKDA